MAVSLADIRRAARRIRDGVIRTPCVESRALSELTGKGTHTTTTARLFHFPGGGELIDSPGIREFSLGHVTRADVEDGFVEFRDLIGRCRFRDCQHDREPGCALLQALESGRIHPQRLASYRHILASLPKAEY